MTTKKLRKAPDILPRYAREPVWRQLSGMSRSRTYRELGAKNLRGKKLNGALFIDVWHGLEWIAAQPDAVIRAPRGKAEPSPVQG